MAKRTTAKRAVLRGFTMIEMLTVIAIIAVLAAISYPVFAAAREAARRTSCSGNLKQIAQGLRMYREDWKVYPDVLYGWQPVDTLPPNLPFGAPRPALFPDYVRDEKTFNCPNSSARLNNRALTSAANMMTGQPHVISLFDPT